MTQPRPIKLLSIWASRFLLLSVVITAVLPIIAWLVFPAAFQISSEGIAAQFLNGTALTLPKQIMGLLITMLPMSCLIYALFQLRKVFVEIAHGRVFSIPAIRSLRGVGIGGCAMVFAQLWVMPLMSLAMTYDFPEGEKQLSVSIGASSNGLLGFFAAIMFLVLAWVLSEARRNAKELAAII